MDVNRYSSRDQLTATWVELAIRLSVLALLLERSADGRTLSNLRLDGRTPTGN